MSRIAPLEAPYAPDIQAHFDAIMPPGAPPLMLFRTIAKSARAWRKFREGSLLDRGPLSLRQREIVIDRVCALTGCEYEWGVHIAAFASKAKLTPEQVRSLTKGDASDACWDEAERALIAGVDALNARARWSEAEFDALKAHYAEVEIFEIIQLCGFYRMMAYFANGLDLPQEPGVPRFKDV